MDVYVFHRVDCCSDNYHTEGGVVVFAATEERAKHLANLEPGCQIGPDEHPDDVRTVDGGDEAVYIMPDAGCC